MRDRLGPSVKLSNYTTYYNVFRNKGGAFRFPRFQNRRRNSAPKPKMSRKERIYKKKNKTYVKKLGFWCYRSDKSVRFVLPCSLFSQSSPLHRNHGKCSVSLSIYLSIYLKFYLFVAVWLPRNLHLGTRNLKRF